MGGMLFSPTFAKQGGVGFNRIKLTLAKPTSHVGRYKSNVGSTSVGINPTSVTTSNVGYNVGNNVGNIS